MHPQRTQHKPSVLHVVTDYKSGGVRFCVEDLINSRLAQSFNFSVCLFDEIPHLRQTAPDLVVFHSACSWAKLPKLFSLKNLGRVIILEHHYNSDFDQLVPNFERFNMMLQMAYNLADQVVAISSKQGEWMLNNQLVKPKKLSIIHGAKNLETFLSIPEPSPKECLVLGAYGRFSPEKGFDVLLKALRLLDDLPVEVLFLLGGDGPEREHLTALAQGLNNIKFRGLINDVPGFLEQCDIVVLPSRRETWGYACMEGKAAARPVIASKVGGLSEQVLDCGLLTVPDNPHALAESITRLCTQEWGAIRALGRRGRQSVRGAWHRYLEQWETLLYQLIRR